MKRWLKILIAVLLALCLLVGAGFWLGNAYQPNRWDYGALWHQYSQEPENSVDVLVLGSSFAYCCVVPAELWRESGVTSFVLAGPRVTASLVYYDLLEALNTQRPNLVLIEASSFFFPEYDEYTWTNISYMPWGANRLAATFRSAPWKERPALLYPLLHNAQYIPQIPFAKAVSRHDDYCTDPLAGYTFIDEAQSIGGEIPFRERPTGEDMKRNLGYLEQIAAVCEENGADLALFLAPNSSVPPAQLQAQITACVPDARFVDFNGEIDRIGLDYSTDFYDVSHLNCLGAQKFSRYLARWLIDEAGLAPTEGADRTFWDGRVAHWDGLLEESALRKARDGE